MKYRTEWKYIANDHDLQILEQKIRAILRYDENASGSIYGIHSLYFDDYRNSCAFDNDAGSSQRCKWRIRYYDDDSSFMKLERKQKNLDLCYKESCPITVSEYDLIISNDVYGLLLSARQKLLKEFCLDIINKKCVPKVIVDYERTALIEPISNVRITFDKNICGSLAAAEFREGSYLKYPLQERGQHILEVKFDDVLPGYLEQLLHSADLQRNTFSKYYLGRTVLERNLL